MFPHIYKENIQKTFSIENSSESLKQTYKSGDIISGRIIRPIEPGKYIIEIRNSNFLATSNLNLKTGEKVYLKVVDTQPKLELQILRSENILKTEEEKIEFLRQLKIEITKLNISILNVLKEEKFPLKAEDIIYIASLVEKYIKNQKRKINKNIIKAVIYLYKKGVKIEEELIKDLEYLFSENTSPDKIFQIFKKIIEKVQNLAEKDTFPAYLNFPFGTDIKKEFAEIFIFREKRDKRKTEIDTTSIYIYLKLESLGRLKIKINSIKKRIDITFSIENEEVLKYFKKFDKELQDRITKLDLKVERILFEKSKDLKSEKIRTFFNIIDKDLKNVDLKV